MLNDGEYNLAKKKVIVQLKPQKKSETAKHYKKNQ